MNRTTPTGWSRVLMIALVVGAATVAVGLGLLGGLIGANICDADGFTCLGWLFWGVSVGCVVAGLLLILLGRRLGLGWWFGVITVAVAVLALLPLPDWARGAAVMLAPVVAAVVTWPTRDRGDQRRRGRPRIGLVLGAAAALAALVVGSLVWDQHRLVTYRTGEYEESGVSVLGPSDPDAWEFDVVISGPPGRDLPPFIQYRLEAAGGKRVAVEIQREQTSTAKPPGNCSTDPHRTAPCSETAPGVYAREGRSQGRFVVRDGAVAEITVWDGSVPEAELDALASSFVVHDARWLASRQSWLYRHLG